MHAIIHIGTHKTGTSSIQNLLYDNRALLREQGLLYPESLCYAPMVRNRLADHKQADHNCLSMHIAHALPGDFINPLRAELAASGCRRLLISAEDMTSAMHHPAQLQRLKDFLQALGCTTICIAVWLRESGALFASLCSQDIKDGRPRYLHGLVPQNSPYLRHMLDNRALLTRWAKVFGRKSLQVRLFEPQAFAGGDLLHDAIDAFDLEWDERFTTPPRVNESLNLLEMELLRVVNHLLDGSVVAPWTVKSRLFEVLHRHVGALDGPGMRFAPPRRIVQAWREWAAEGNEWVRREFFPKRQTLFAPPQDRAENYELNNLTPGCWEAIGRVLCELSEVNFRLQRDGVQPQPPSHP